MPREGGLYGNAGGLLIANFADHDDVRILSQEAAERGRKRQADALVNVGLIGGGQLVLNRVLDRADVHRVAVKRVQGRVEGRGLTASRILNADPGIEVVDTAKDGAEAPCSLETRKYGRVDITEGKRGLETGIDLLFECFDAIESSLKHITQNQTEQDSGDLVRRAQAFLASEQPAQSAKPRDAAPLMPEKIRAIEVKVERLDTLMTLAEELLVNRLRLGQCSDRLQDPELSAAADTISRLVTELDVVLKTGNPGVLEMQASESLWDKEKAYLVSLGDVADLAGQVRRHGVDVVGQFLPGAGDARDVCLGPEFALGSDLAGHTRHLAAKQVQAFDHAVIRVGQFAEDIVRLSLEPLRQVAHSDGFERLKESPGLPFCFLA